jgi:hypothetical protein
MIALPAGLPLIRINQNLAACEPDWLHNTLRKAAKGSDVPEWLAEDVGRGVEAFLRNHYEGTVIDVEDLFEKIRTTLENLGLGELVANLDSTPPQVKISLTDLARRAGSGYELAFFQLLEERFRSAAYGGAEELNCYGLDKCVRKLMSAQRWSARCETLKEEIREFLQAEQEKAMDQLPKLTLFING